MAGILYIVATPIGNLEDLTLRALRVLKEVDIILAEDTRITKRLLLHYDIDNPIMSYHQHSGENKRLKILNMLTEGKNLALVTDSGTPGISDPGNELIDFILKSWKEPKRLRGSGGDSIASFQNRNIKIIPIPGPAAITTALSISGFKTSKFVFLGFLPKRKRLKLFSWLKETKMTFAFYESPNRLKKTLNEFKEHFEKGTRIFVARELTKIHETKHRGTISQVIKMIEKDTLKGEIVVVVECN